MSEAQPSPEANRAVQLRDYQPPAFLIDQVDLSVELFEEYTQVQASLSLRRNPRGAANAALVLDGGTGLQLQSIALDGAELDPTRYSREGETLTISGLGDTATLTTVVTIDPAANTTLEGLYRSRQLYCTQCEAEGFRHITFYLDRPDVLAEFHCRISADKQTFPVLLSNGNRIDSGELDGGRHFVQWHDPFKKPCYLFALVAGDLASVSDSFTTASGREVELVIYVEEKDLDKCDHAMRSLKASMAWDEQRYGREYDLDLFMIVAVDDFNMGAMENKGLNIFNTSAVLANPKVATDATFQRIESIVAHEYFHNWSGNRVTCRDWFQLSLKEGFTVFRDAQFSADMNAAVVKRIEDVGVLRTLQFAEDAGPLAHPVQPQSYVEINNFYTVTVYEKGAEVVGMLYTLLGEAQFRAGSELYFERYDGQAVTIEEFVSAMEEVSGRDLQQFRQWYWQAGTPELECSWQWDEQTKLLSLTVEQHCPPTPGQPNKAPFHIPVRVGMVGEQGDLVLSADGTTEQLLELTGNRQQWQFGPFAEQPVPSLLRGFSAPVKLKASYSEAQLLHLAGADSDGFNRWEAMQQLYQRALIHALEQGEQWQVGALLAKRFTELLADAQLDCATAAQMLTLPGESELFDLFAPIDPARVIAARNRVRKQLAAGSIDLLTERYQALIIDQPYAADNRQIGQRALKNLLLRYLCECGNGQPLAAAQFARADNMTDQLAALSALLVDASSPAAQSALASFYQQWKDEPLALNLWFRAQATAPSATPTEVRQLLAHSDFTFTNPNKVRSVIAAFCMVNHSQFHSQDGAGYQLLSEVVGQLNTINPQIAARLVTPLTGWKKFSQPYSEQMRESLQRIASLPELAKDIAEQVGRSLSCDES